MATLLRSSKYIRCLNGFAQRIIDPHKNINFVTKNVALQVQSTNAYLTKSYATIPSLQRSEGNSHDDGNFNKLDESVRRIGRVFKPDVESTLAHIRNAGYVTNLDALLLIRCCGDLLADAPLDERKKLTQDIWNTFDALKIHMDVSHFNALLSVYLENNCELSPIDFLTTMKNKNIHPNRITYERLMLFYCKKGDIDGATKILEVFKEKEIPLSGGVFDALIIGHSEANDMENAEQVIKVMTDAGVRPSSSTYTALLCAHAKRGNMESIRKIINELETTNIFLHHSNYFEIIQTLATNGHKDMVDDILALIPQGPNYNLDAVIGILKVLDTGHVDVALQILKTLKKRRGTDEHMTENDSGSFLIKKLVNAKYPQETIAETCRKLQDEGINVRAFAIAVGRCLELGDVERSIPLLKAWMEYGGEIREHYFWPLLVTKARATNYQGILDIIRHMVSLKITPSVDTIKDYVVPYVVGGWTNVITSLEELHIPRSVTISAIACKMLSEDKIHNTFRFLSTFESAYEVEDMYGPLAEAVKSTNDTQSFVAIIRLLQNSLPEMAHSIVDTAIRTLLMKVSGEPPMYMMVDKILQHMEEFGLNISKELGLEIRQYFQDYINPTIDQTIEKLSSGVLTPISMSELTSRVIPNSGDSGSWDDSTTNQTIMMYSQKRRLIVAAMKENKVAEVNKLAKEMESGNFTFTIAFLAQLIEFYCSVGDIEQAEKWMNKCRAREDGHMLDLHKSVLWAELLIKNNRFDDAIQFLSSLPKESGQYDSRRSRWLLKGLLNTAAETGNVEKTNELFEILLKYNYFAAENFFLSALVKVHLNRGDVQGALDSFENACRRHQCTPQKNELLRKLIEMEDAISLQRLTDLNSEIHGESNSLLDLILSFIECGRLRQARKILETPELRLRGKKLLLATERYIEQGNMELLEQFMEITKGLAVIDRKMFYEVLLDAYCKKNNWQRGLGLWTDIQDENLQPTEKFLISLGHLLKRNGQPIPFELESISTFTNHSETTAISKETAESSKEFKEILTAFVEGNYDRGNLLLQRWKSPKHADFRFAIGFLVETMVKQYNKLHEATKLIEDMATIYGASPTAFTYKTVWNALVEAKEYETLVNHGNTLTKELKQNYRFHKYLIRAYLHKVGLSTFLSEFEAKLTQSKDHNFTVVGEGLHFSAIVGELHKNPNCADKFHAIAEKLAKQEIHSPINMIWSYYFEKNDPKAEEVWAKWFSSASRILFRHVVETSMRNNDIELMERLYQKVETNSKLSHGAKTNVLAPLVELYRKNGRLEDALKLANNANPETVAQWTEKFPIYYENFQNYLQEKGKSFIPKKSNDTKHNDNIGVGA